ncbi:MAG TPA: type II toxin-antitoxin system PemK/MazF family toxin [Desulfurella acetivorans]|uniref:mRNA interferase n=1 Tax=Desulfurella acetivorans TaxID=33002 RepID=A0A7C6EB78_DESAE|nr:type II toxin-antitoxin system PemK/MazF family toxin [Desulfurella acetivorans]
MKTPKRFEIWLVNWNPARGSEQEGIRPSLIIQVDSGNINQNYPNTIVVTISTKGKSIPFHIKVSPSKENGLSSISYVKCEQILTISKERLTKKLGILEEQYKEKVEEALKSVLNLE